MSNKDLDIAFRYDDNRLIEWYIDNGWIFSNGYFNLCCQHGKLKIAESLLKRGIFTKEFAYYVAFSKRNLNLIQYIFSTGLELPDHIYSLAINNYSQIEVFEWIKQYVSPSVKDFNLAINRNNNTAIEWILSIVGSNPEFLRDALFVYIEQFHWPNPNYNEFDRIFELLFSRVERITMSIVKAISILVSMGDNKALKICYKYHQTIYNSWISTAIRSNQISILTWILSQKTEFNCNLFIYPAISGNLEIFNLLINFGLRDHTNESITLAAFNGHLKIVKAMYNQDFPLDMRAWLEAKNNNKLNVADWIRNKYYENDGIKLLTL